MKKQKKGKKEQWARLKIPTSFKIGTEKNYRKIVTLDIITTTPKFNNENLITCNKGHAQGSCFENCDCKRTHKAFPDDQQKRNTKWQEKAEEA